MPPHKHTQEHLMALPSSYDLTSSIDLLVVAFHYWIYHSRYLATSELANHKRHQYILQYREQSAPAHVRVREHGSIFLCRYNGEICWTSPHPRFFYLNFGRRRADVLLYSTIHHPLTRSWHSFIVLDTLLFTFPWILPPWRSPRSFSRRRCCSSIPSLKAITLT